MGNVTKRLTELEQAVKPVTKEPDIRYIEVMDGDEVMMRMDWNPETGLYETTYERPDEETE